MLETFYPGYTIGVDAYNRIWEICKVLGNRVLIIGGATAIDVAMPYLLPNLSNFEIINTIVYGKECSRETVEKIYEPYKNCGADFIIGIGGGKALDVAKYVADLMGVRVVTVPTIASTCAASSALSVVYTPEHIFEGFRRYNKPAFHCFINSKIIADAPYTFLRAGIGDTLAKYYEVGFSARGRKNTFSDEAGISMSRMCNTPLFENACLAVKSAMEHIVTDELEKVALIIIISTGMVSMLVEGVLNGAVAHALFYGLTNIEGFEEKFLHGDVVGYCTMVQLVLDNQPEEAIRVGKLLKSIGVETTLSQRGIPVSKEILYPCLTSAIKDPDMEVIPYTITEDMLFEAICKVEEMEEEKRW